MSLLAEKLNAVAAGVVAVGISGAVLGAVTAAHAAGDRERDVGGTCEQQFDRAVRTYTETTHERDVAGWASVLHPDVTVAFASGYVLYGKKQTVDWAREFFADRDWTQTFEELTRSVDGCRTGFILFDSVYTPGPGGDPKPLVIGLTFTYERGRWLVLHNQDSNGPSIGTPPGATAAD